MDARHHRRIGEYDLTSITAKPWDFHEGTVVQRRPHGTPRLPPGGHQVRPCANNCLIGMKEENSSVSGSPPLLYLNQLVYVWRALNPPPFTRGRRQTTSIFRKGRVEAFTFYFSETHREENDIILCRLVQRNKQGKADRVDISFSLSIFTSIYISIYLFLSIYLSIYYFCKSFFFLQHKWTFSRDKCLKVMGSHGCGGPQK